MSDFGVLTVLTSTDLGTKVSENCENVEIRQRVKPNFLDSLFDFGVLTVLTHFSALSISKESLNLVFV